MNGINADEIFSGKNGYTYDDIILLPGFIDFQMNDINLECKLTEKISLKTPIVSSPMDTVTESNMAINIALQGGLGIIHCNNTISEQLEHVKKVKRYNNGFILDPIVLNPDQTVKKILEIQEECGFSGFPITNNGKMGGKLVGFVSKRDFDFIDDKTTKIKDIMTTDLVTGKWDFSLEQSYNILKENKVSRLPILNDRGDLCALVSRKDQKKSRDFPLATKDPRTNQLIVGGAVTTHLKDRERIDTLVVDGNVDILVIDASQGNSIYQLDTIKYIKDNYPNVGIVGGNVVTKKQAEKLIEAGVDALREGMGVGSICTTQNVCGVGRSQANAIFEVSEFCKEKGVSVIADGGISNSGHIVKALVLGASFVMLGSLLAGTDESCGEYVYRDGIKLKKYRGMGSIEAMKKNSSRRYQSEKESVSVAQGVNGIVSSKGSIHSYIPHLIQGVKHGFQNIGAISIEKAHSLQKSGEISLEIRSLASQLEGNVHNLFEYNN